MREYFVLSYDDSDELEVVSDYDLGDFDLTTLWTGQRIEGRIPAGVRLWVGKGEPADFLGNPLSWQIVSTRLWLSIQPLVARDCEELSAPLYYEEGRAPVPGYVLLNPTRCLSAVKKTANDVDVTITDLVLDPTQIPIDVNMFRLAESSTVIIVSDSVVRAVWGKGFKGLAFLKTSPA